jgi:hypothetical protein
MNRLFLISSLSVVGLTTLVLAIKTMVSKAKADGFHTGFQVAQQSIIDSQFDDELNRYPMPQKDGYSRIYEEALRLAARLHREQNRKGCDVPYITHPVQVSLILLNDGFPIEVVIAGLLHDIVEDCGYEIRRIAWQFGERVAGIVDALSERKVDGQGKKRSWDERKQGALKQLRQADDEAAAVKAADTLHNARCIALDVRQEGARVWERFSRGPESIMTYYYEVLKIVYGKLGYHPLVRELWEALDDLKKIINEVGVGNEDIYVGADGDWLQDRLPRAWNLPRPFILGNAPSDVVLQQEVMPMNVAN